MSELLNLINTIPTFVWVVLGIIALFAVLGKAGDRAIWKYEVEFPLSEGVGRAEVEIKHWKKRGKVLELEIKPVKGFGFKEVYVLVGGYKAFSASHSEFNKWSKCEKEYKFEKPNEGDEVKVLFDGKEVFSGVLLVD